MTALLATPPTRPPRARPAPAGRPDDLVVFAVRSVALFPAARALAWDLGEEVFQDPAARLLVSWLLAGGVTPTDPGPRLRGELARLLREVHLAQVPPADDPEWGLHLLRLLAEREHRPLLASTLRWAAAGVKGGIPLRYLRRRVHEAFAVAEGRRAVDAALLAGGRREEWRP